MFPNQLHQQTLKHTHAGGAGQLRAPAAPWSPSGSRRRSPQAQKEQETGLDYDTIAVVHRDNARTQNQKVQKAFSDYNGTGLVIIHRCVKVYHHMHKNGVNIMHAN